MRDLLYLSDSKLAALVPQLPGRVRRRLGVEAGLNAWIVSVRAALPGEPQQPAVALLDEVVSMIEKDRGLRGRHDRDLRAGDWIRFEETFHHGSAWPGSRGEVCDLVYFAAADPPPFLLVGSATGVLDRRAEPGGSAVPQVGRFYTDALRAYAAAVTGRPDGGATGAVEPATGGSRSLFSAVSWLCNVETRREPGWSAPVRLAGVARVLGVGEPSDGREGDTLATPLYVEYAPR